ncbi:unnamed protein product [Mytilus edulis]|uniref:Reverse transcriptase/retrotransposon-derived protein RNase H-like domain-containing protein n=1 Tax=Mytilus edulis TaxID=6550 RepID=A0A8S3RXV7_MYTED|nr:unnamed protein product [Mytilus edulis]
MPPRQSFNQNIRQPLRYQNPQSLNRRSFYCNGFCQDRSQCPATTINDVDTTSILSLDDNQSDNKSKTSSLNSVQQTSSAKSDLHFDFSKSDLTDQQKQKLTTFLNENRDVFATSLKELGKTNVYHHKIDTGNSKPIKSRPYRTSPAAKQEIQKQIDELLKYDIIEPSTSSAIGYILSQFGEDKKEHVIGYRGRALSPAEKNYTVTEQEMLALVSQKALSWLQTIKHTNSRLIRWALKLQEYNFEVIHRPGSRNQHCDSLSRRDYNNTDHNSDSLTEITFVFPEETLEQITNTSENISVCSLDEISTLQKACPYFGPIIDFLEKEFCPMREKELMQYRMKLVNMKF